MFRTTREIQTEGCGWSPGGTAVGAGGDGGGGGAAEGGRGAEAASRGATKPPRLIIIGWAFSHYDPNGRQDSNRRLGF